MLRSNSRCISWLRAQLPELVSTNVISREAAAAIEQHYAGERSRSRNLGIVILAVVGSALVAAGIVLLIAHNWDDLSRPVRVAIAIAPLIIAQTLGIFVLLRRDESPPWRESIAIFVVAAVAAAISLVSQTYQVQGTFANFMLLWLVLSLPIVYLFRTTFGAAAYIIGSVVWLFSQSSWIGRHDEEQLFFWVFLLAIVPFYAFLVRNERHSGRTAWLSILLFGASAFGLESVAELVRSGFGALSFAGVCACAYLCGIKFFPKDDGRLSMLALLGGIGIGVTAIVLGFENAWNFSSSHSSAVAGWAREVGMAIQWIFPLVATTIYVWDLARRNQILFSFAAGALPIVTGIGWLIANQGYGFSAALVFNLYAFALGVELLARGIRAGSTARANFGLLLIVALAMARFFDSDLSFVTRGVGFIAVGIGFLLTNIYLFKKRAKA